MNNLTSNTLKVGKTLKVATTEEEIIPENYLLYKVKSGDSLWKIANEYGTTVDTLKEINKLKSNTLTINQQIFIPKTTESGVDTEKIYTVKFGDTLSEIAKTYNISVSELKNENNLTSDFLSIGQVLIIPDSSTGEINYIVQKGDNLYNVANKYGVSVNDIVNLNNLSTTVLQIGQIIKIPGSTNYNTYIVKKGDSLWKIANEYNTTINKIMTINNLSSTNLDIGDSLLIPTN